MAISDILTSLDREISLLQQARAVLSGSTRAPKVNSRPAAAKPAKSASKKRNLSPEGRRRIAEAVKRRWERQRKAATTSAKK
jgi:hypothetical protein